MSDIFDEVDEEVRREQFRKLWERYGNLFIAVAVLILAPIVALMWVGSYAKPTPRLWGMPFFFWYQFLWVFLAAACTYAAYRIVIATTPPRPGRQRYDGGEAR